MFAFVGTPLFGCTVQGGPFSRDKSAVNYGSGRMTPNIVTLKHNKQINTKNTINIKKLHIITVCINIMISISLNINTASSHISQFSTTSNIEFSGNAKQWSDAGLMKMLNWHNNIVFLLSMLQFKCVVKCQQVWSATSFHVMGLAGAGEMRKQGFCIISQIKSWWPARRTYATYARVK